MLRRFVFFAVIFCACAADACASDYAEPTWANLARTMVRFHALDLSDASMLDEYATITECDVYNAFYHNDFKWQQVRKAVLSSVDGDVATFPTGYRYEVPLHLDRYDFTAKVFRFTTNSVLHNINSLELYHSNGKACDSAPIKLVPVDFHAVLSSPLYMDGLPLDEKESQILVAAMDASKNTDRTIYARFNVRITYIEPLRKFMVQVGHDLQPRYGQTEAFTGSVRLDARLESVEFYEDPARTVLIYQYQL